jgi:hypothetical protein
LNQPFTTVENDEFHELLGYLKGFVGEKIVKGNQMAQKVQEGFLQARE